MKQRANRDVRLTMEKNDLEYQEEMERIKHRVLSRPLLVEQAPYFNIQTQTEEEMEERPNYEEESRIYEEDRQLIEIEDAERQEA